MCLESRRSAGRVGAHQGSETIFSPLPEALRPCTSARVGCRRQRAPRGGVVAVDHRLDGRGWRRRAVGVEVDETRHEGGALRVATREGACAAWGGRCTAVVLKFPGGGRLRLVFFFTPGWWPGTTTVATPVRPDRDARGEGVRPGDVRVRWRAIFDGEGARVIGAAQRAAMPSTAACERGK